MADDFLWQKVHFEFYKQFIIRKKKLTINQQSEMQNFVMKSVQKIYFFHHNLFSDVNFAPLSYDLLIQFCVVAFEMARHFANWVNLMMCLACDKSSRFPLVSNWFFFHCEEIWELKCIRIDKFCVLKLLWKIFTCTRIWQRFIDLHKTFFSILYFPWREEELTHEHEI